MALVDASRASAEAGGGRCVARAPATRSSSSWREEEDDWQEPVDWAELGQARATGKSLFSLSFLFFIYSIISVTSGLY